MTPESNTNTAERLQRNDQTANAEFKGLPGQLLLPCERPKSFDADLDVEGEEEPLFAMDVEGTNEPEPAFELDAEVETHGEPVFELDAEAEMHGEPMFELDAEDDGEAALVLLLSEDEPAAAFSAVVD